MYIHINLLNKSFNSNTWIINIILLQLGPTIMSHRGRGKGRGRGKREGRHKFDPDRFVADMEAAVSGNGRCLGGL